MVKIHKNEEIKIKKGENNGKIVENKSDWNVKMILPAANTAIFVQTNGDSGCSHLDG